MRPSFLALSFCLLPALAAPGEAARVRLDLPIRVPGAVPRVPAPAYAGDVIELRLAPAASRLAAPAYRSRVADGRLGVVAVDRLAVALGGVRFEPMFRGERAPEDGSVAPDFTAFYVAHLPAGVALEEALDRFGALPEVASASPIFASPLDLVPNDSLMAASSWYFQPSRQDIHAREAWDVSTGDTSIVVGILDTGVVPYHPDLGGVIAGLPRQIYTNWAEASGTPGVDDDGNGFVDDVHGWDFVALASAFDVFPGEDWRDQDNDPNDFVGHGTACAGLVGALTDNTLGVAGVNWNVRIMPLRIGWAFGGANLGAGEVRMDFIVQAILYAARNGVRVINCSFASLSEPGLDAALDQALASGMTVVTSAGNNGQPNYIATRREVISVAATGPTDVLAGFSNRGPQVDLAAPGQSIASTFLGPRPSTTDSVALRQGSYSSTLSGTSFSSPLTAGAAALLQARQAQLGKPPLDPIAVLLRLFDTTDDIRAQNPGLDGQYGNGRLDVARALTETWRSGVARLPGKVVGPVGVMRLGDGSARVVIACDNRVLVMLDGSTLDTAWTVTLPFTPASGPALAVVPGQGVGIFVGLSSGRVAGYRQDGSVLPGWPTTGGNLPMGGGPAIADLDADGSPEIVCGSSNGDIYAWHSDGSVVTGFPVTVSAVGSVNQVAVMASPPGQTFPGCPPPCGLHAVIAGVADDGTVLLIDQDGGPLPGWPLTFASSPTTPILMPVQGAPSVVVAENNLLHALDLAAAERPGFPVTLAATASNRAEPAIGDLDQNGVDDVMIACGSRLEVRDSTGASLVALGWPRTLAAPCIGSPVLGRLTGLGAPGAMQLLTSGLTGFASNGDSLLGFPKPGGGGTFPTLVDLDGDGTTEVLAGSSLDKLLFVYDVGPGSAAGGPHAWPTLRGNFQRTGSTYFRPAIPLLDLVAPAGVADLTAGVTGVAAVLLRWTAPGDDGGIGRAYRYDVRRSLAPINAGNFAGGTLVPSGVPAPGGSPDSLALTGLAEGVPHYFALRAFDDAGNVGPISNVATATLAVVSPGAVTDLRVIATTDSSVTLAWTATGDDGTVGRPQLYVVRGANAPIDDANFLQAPYVRSAPATVDAGGTEMLLIKFLQSAKRYWFALKAYDSSANGSPLSNVVIAQTGVGGPLDSRPGLALAPGSNPSRVPARLYWQAAPEAAGQRQEIRIYDLTGRLIRTLDPGQGIGGVVSWDGADGNGNRVPAGLYVARFASGPFRTQARLVLLP